jgi:anti-sigma B factor antagonist
MTSRPDPASNGDRPASDCTITEQRRGDICLIAVTGALDALTIHQLEAAMTWPATKVPKAVIVDLTAVDFLASAGMGLLVSAHNALTPAARFAVVASGPATGRPLALVGIANIIDVYATLSEALIALAEKER